jgi:hypothetical protein
MEEYDKIINKIKEINPVAPGPDLTPAIMHEINRISKRSYALILRRPFFLIKDIFATSPTKEECVISFISMGVFYLIFGSILLFFIKSIPANSEMNIWLKLQSPVFILVALWLTVLGSAVWFMGRKAIWFARWGLVIYILIFVVSTAVMSAGGNVALLLGTGLSMGAVLTGISLNISVGKYGCESNVSRG